MDINKPISTHRSFTFPRSKHTFSFSFLQVVSNLLYVLVPLHISFQEKSAFNTPIKQYFFVRSFQDKSAFNSYKKHLLSTSRWGPPSRCPGHLDTKQHPCSISYKKVLKFAPKIEILLFVQCVAIDMIFCTMFLTSWNSNMMLI